MSTVKTTNVTHGSNSGTANMVLASDGDITFAKKPALGRQVLEQFFTPCDGSVIACANGNITVQDVTAEQDCSTTYTDLTGSVISYNPPTGTTQVIYEFYYQAGRKDDVGSHLCKLYLDSDEVTLGFAHNQVYASTARLSIKWGFNIGGSADTTHGRVASWSSAKTIKIQIREFDSAQEVYAHRTVHSGAGSSTDIFVTPCIGITAIG